MDLCFLCGGGGVSGWWCVVCGKGKGGGGGGGGGRINKYISRHEISRARATRDTSLMGWPMHGPGLYY